MTLTTRQLNHPPGDPVTHLDPYPTSYRPPGRLHRRTSFRLNGAASLVPPLGIRRWGGVGKMVGHSMERQGRWWRWVDSMGVLTRRRPGHMVDLEQKRREDSEEEKPRIGSTTDASVVEQDQHARVRLHP
jgi:hypothetical protein